MLQVHCYPHGHGFSECWIMLKIIKIIWIQHCPYKHGLCECLMQNQKTIKLVWAWHYFDEHDLGEGSLQCQKLTN